MNIMKALAISAVVVLLTCSTAFADVQLSMQNGRVSIVAKDATVRQILTEWARVGQTKIVNVERIPGGPLTLELTNVPEQQALDLLLRSISGYMAAARQVGAAPNVSLYDRIVVMPTPVAPRAAVAAAPPPPAAYPQPQFPQPQPADDDVDDERPQPAVPMPVPAPAQRAPVFNSFPQPQVMPTPTTVQTTVAPQVMPPMQQPFGGAQGQVPVAQPQATPTAPFGGVAVPGMVVQPPQPTQPGVVVPGQPRRPGEPEGL